MMNIKEGLIKGGKNIVKKNKAINENDTNFTDLN